MYWNWTDPSGRIILKVRPIRMNTYMFVNHHTWLTNNTDKPIREFEINTTIYNGQGFVTRKRSNIDFSNVDPGETHVSREYTERRAKINSGFVKLDDGTKILIDPKTVEIHGNIVGAAKSLGRWLGQAIRGPHRSPVDSNQASPSPPSL